MEIWIKIMQKYGAVFENVKLVEENGSFSVHAVDKEKESILKAVPSVLIPGEAIEIKNDTHHISESFFIKADLREVFDSYLDFILSDERVERQKKIYESFIDMPKDLKDKLFSFGLSSLFKEKNKKEVKIALASARTIVIDGKIFLMPIIDFMNHDFKEGIAFTFQEGSVTVKGLASPNGELFATYNGVSDAFSMLNVFTFVSENIAAFSMGIELNLGNTVRLSIGRELLKYEKTKEGLFLPEYSVSKNRIRLSHLWLGSHQVPENPYKSFKKLWEERLQQTDAQKIYSVIKGLNITALVSILRLCDKAEENLAVEMVKESVLQQLRLIGESYEA